MSATHVGSWRHPSLARWRHASPTSPVFKAPCRREEWRECGERRVSRGEERREERHKRDRVAQWAAVRQLCSLPRRLAWGVQTTTMVCPASALLAARLQRATRGLPYVTEELRRLLKSQDVAEAWGGRAWLKVAKGPHGSGGKCVRLQREACGCELSGWKWCTLTRHHKSTPTPSGCAEKVRG